LQEAFYVGVILQRCGRQELLQGPGDAGFHRSGRQPEDAKLGQIRFVR
jgi:hypothetical protein